MKTMRIEILRSPNGQGYYISEAAMLSMVRDANRRVLFVYSDRDFGMMERSLKDAVGKVTKWEMIEHTVVATVELWRDIPEDKIPSLSYYATTSEKSKTATDLQVEKVALCKKDETNAKEV